MARVEELLERLVEQNADILERMESMLSAIDEIRHSVDWTNQGSGTKQILESLDQIESALQDISMNTSE